MEKKLNVAVMAGGDSSEYEISVDSAGQVVAAMDPARYNLFPITVRGRSWAYTDPQGTAFEVDKNDFSLPLAPRVPLDYALILIHGTPGEDGLLQAYFEMMGIPFSTCGFFTSAVTFDKAMCKKAVACTGVALAGEVVLGRNSEFDPEAIVEKLGLPLFVKPNASGSSFGVSKVKAVEELPRAIEKALEESDRVLIEECLVGDEVDCGVLVTAGEEFVFPLTEIVSKNEFFDFEAKYTPGMSDEITPARIPEAAARKVREASLKIYKELNCKGIVRFDFIVQDGTPFFIELNTVPGMSRGSIVPKQIRAMGRELPEMIDRVILDTITPRR